VRLHFPEGGEEWDSGRREKGGRTGEEGKVANNKVEIQDDTGSVEDDGSENCDIRIRILYVQSSFHFLSSPSLLGVEERPNR
jgi:hypothetical protein